MDFLRKHRKIYSALAAFLVAVLVVYSYGSFRSYAAAPEVSTLPADIDIDVTYDADTVTFTYNNVTHSIDRNTRYEYINSSSTSNPKFLERTFIGYYIPASYWFSPSENRLYVFSGCTDNSVSSETTLSDFCYILGYVPGSNNATTDIVGNFYLHNNAGGYNSTFMYFIDYNFGYVCNTYKLYSDDGLSRDRNICYWYPDVAKINGEDAYKVLGVSSTKRYYFPADLICVFSNYEISGFYEFDNSKVNTPSYYFNFQYIFYKEKYGYIFVDSAKRVREVGFPNNVNNPRFFFEDICNSYVYSSSDGVSWTLLTTTSTAYAKYFEVSTGISWTDYTLIYTNDKNFGTPLVTPSYGEISDVIGDLSAITNNYHDTINNTSVSLVDTPESNTSLWDYFASLEGGLLAALKDYTGFPIFSTLSSYMHSSDISDESVLLTKLLDNFTSDVSWYYDSSDSTLHTYTSLYGYVHHMYESIVDNGIYIESFMKVSHADLKSVFDNITLSNQYLKRISDNLDSLSIPAASPDYSGRFDMLSAALDKLHNDLIYEEGVTKLPNVPQYLVYVYSVTKDIRTKLDTIIGKMSAGSVEVDTDSIVTAVSDMQTAVTDKLDSVIAKIPSGGGSFDDSNMVGSIVSLKADISDNFTTLIKLLKNDTDDVTDFKDLSEFLTNYIVSMGNAAYFTTLLEFADGVKNNVVLINETMSSMVSDSGIYAPVFVLGAGFAVFSGLIRKERMS